MADWVDLYRTIVMPAHCDSYGHMNVRHYASMFDDAGWHVMELAGVSLNGLRQRGLGTVVGNISIDFHHEIKAGQLVLIRGGVRRVGGKSFTHELRLYESESMTHCATQTTIEVCFDTAARKSVAMPDEMRAKLQAAILPAD